MRKRSRRNHSAVFKAKVALAAVKGEATFYNTRRPHSSLDRQTPDHVYFKSLPLAAAA
jgi:putative transposase